MNYLCFGNLWQLILIILTQEIQLLHVVAGQALLAHKTQQQDGVCFQVPAVSQPHLGAGKAAPA